MPNNLLTPILNDRTRAVNFFNGRLLTGEDLTAEQKANRVAHGLLGQAIGSGVAYGFEVSESRQSSTVQAPVLAITQGLAINRNGTALFLQNDTEIALVRPANGGTAPARIFEDCTPVQMGAYVADAGVYLLTTGPASMVQGLAEVSGVNTGSVPCNSNFKAEGVQFRLVQIDLAQLNLVQTDLTDPRLRNLVAYRFFGVTDWASVVTDPFGTPPPGFGLIDQLRTAQIITDCEVPLAVLYWTATDGLKFVDMWAVRRHLVSKDLLDRWAPGAGRRRLAEGMAMFLQFEAQVNDLMQSPQTGAALSSASASDYFLYLPPVGLLPLAGTQTPIGFTYSQFFNNVTRSCAQTSDKLCAPFFLEGAKVNQLVYRSLLYPAINLGSKEMIWLYWVRENMQPGTGHASGVRPYLIFTNGHVPNEGQAQFDLNYWGYANFV